MKEFVHIPTDYSVIIFIIYQLPFLLSAYYLSCIFLINNIYEKVITVFTFYILSLILCSALAGFFGILYFYNVFILAIGLSLITIYISRKFSSNLTMLKDRQITTKKELLIEKVTLCIAVGFISFLIYTRLSIPILGWDAMLYHLFFPASWLQQGNIFRLTVPHYPYMEYYPINGELLFCSWIIPVGADAIVKVMSLVILFFIFITVTTLSLNLGCKRLHALCGAFCSLTCGLCFRHANIANTDMIVGLFLLLSVTFFLLSGEGYDNFKLFLCGLVLGCAIGTKYLGFLLGGGVFGIIIFFLIINWKGIVLLKKLILFILSTTIFSSYYFLWNFLLTGNPVYPINVSIFGHTILPGALAKNLVSKPIGLSFNAWSFFVKSNDYYSVSYSVAVLFLIILITVPFLNVMTYKNKKKTSKVFFIYMCTLFSFILTLSFYPTEAQPRQIIPSVILAWALIPFIITTLGKNRILNFVLLVIFLVGGGYSQVSIKHIPFFIIYGIIVFLLFSIVKINKTLKWITLILLFFIVQSLMVNQIIIANKLKYKLYSYLINSKESSSWEFLDKLNTKYPSAITAFNIDRPYPLLGSNLNRKIIYIPISEKNTIHPHEFPLPKIFSREGRLVQMRKPTNFDMWFKRLCDKNVKYLVCFTDTSKLYDGTIEFKWAEKHTDKFKLLNYNDTIAIYEVLSTNCL
jgi:hypothetical protein